MQFHTKKFALPHGLRCARFQKFVGALFVGDKKIYDDSLLREYGDDLAKRGAVVKPI